MLSEALRLIRVFHDLKQHELADKLCLSKSYVSELETGKKSPSLEVIQKYSEAFSIPASSILFFSEGLENPSKLRAVKTAIAEKVIRFLQLVEDKTSDEKI